MMAGAPSPPLNIVTTSRFERDSKRVRKRGKDMRRLLAVVDDLRNRRPLNVQIYRIDRAAGDLILNRTGTHADLFGK